jgi:hypothetical protein
MPNRSPKKKHMKRNALERTTRMKGEYLYLTAYLVNCYYFFVSYSP